MRWIDDLERVIYITINSDGVTEICDSNSMSSDYETFYITVVHLNKMLGFVINATDEKMADMIAMYYSDNYTQYFSD